MVRLTGLSVFFLSFMCFLLSFLLSPSQSLWAEKESRGKETKNPVLKAMKDELDRSMKQLNEKGDPAPYFIAYRVTEKRTVTISASFGSIRDNVKGCYRRVDVDVRVGSRKMDNTHPLRGNHYSFDYSNPVIVTFEDDPDALRSVLWQETDKKYKKAAENLIKIKANQTVSVKEEDQSDDLSQEAAYFHIEEPATLPENFDGGAWEKKLKEYSLIFKNFPGLHQAQVRLTGVAENKYFVNSEGTVLLHGRTHWRIGFSAQTTAEDGMKLSKGESFDARRLENLPGDETIFASIREVAGDVSHLREAPLMDPYTGPAILSGNAAAVFFHEIFGHRIEGHRQKDETEGQTFAKMIHQPVLPKFISVYDDPTLKQMDAVDLNGHYLFDDQGIPSQRVDLVVKGNLENFLMSRSPIKGFPRSNGHGRAQAGFMPVSRQGNLIVEASKGVSEKKLRGILLDECKKQGKSYGLYFKDVSGGVTNTSRYQTEAFNVLPITVYKVYVDGRPDELVRGVTLIGTPLTSFSKILACGKKQGIFNGYCGAESGQIPASAISPPMLTAQIEVQKKIKSSNKPPVLPPPAWSKEEKGKTGERVPSKTK